MTINNLHILLPLMDFSNEDEFFHLQILKRKKENPELGSNSYVVKTYYVQSEQYLKDKMPEIIALCDIHNARAYLNLSPRSFEKTAFNTLKKVSDCIMNKDYKSVRKAYESVAGAHGNGKRKKWVIDYDFIDPSVGCSSLDSDNLNELEKISTELQIEAGQEPLTMRVPTKNGTHIITKPFNVAKFLKEKLPPFDMHKNNPTILYMK